MHVQAWNPKRTVACTGTDRAADPFHYSPHPRLATVTWAEHVGVQRRPISEVMQAMVLDGSTSLQAISASLSSKRFGTCNSNLQLCQVLVWCSVVVSHAILQAWQGSTCVTISCACVTASCSHDLACCEEGKGFAPDLHG